jgi:hypothetical protein
MNLTEPIGYLASALVLATFCMRDMAMLRSVAIASNLTFMLYGAMADLGPVLVLHLLLLPVNLQRLLAARSGTKDEMPRGEPTSAAAATTHPSPARCRSTPALRPPSGRFGRARS